MPKRMLIDSSHPEETRVVVLDGSKVDEFDFEAATKRPLKGNIYLAKVTRVEPSLQAAFVEYGGNRQGFLAFSEIHPDYYQIPVADRMALLAEQEAEARRRHDDEFEAVETGTALASDEQLSAEDEAEMARREAEEAEQDSDSEDGEHDEGIDREDDEAGEVVAEGTPGPKFSASEDRFEDDHVHHHHETTEADDRSFSDDSFETGELSEIAHEEIEDGVVDQQTLAEGEFVPEPDEHSSDEFQNHEHSSFDTMAEAEVRDGVVDQQALAESPDSAEQPAQQLRSSRPSQRWTRRRHYKIQEVVKRRQILLVQVVKEERGNKGAALTTYLSLPGRYCVLMPNTPRGGGISRKITNPGDRKRLKAAAAALELPEGMGLIIRTAGENRTKLEIKRDYEYLLRMWDQIRELTLKSNAPACVYEEGDLIKRAIRDLYNKDVAEIIVEGEDGYRNAKDFMRMLMPSHAKNVKPYKEPISLYQRFKIEPQLDAMFSPTVTLKSGGYIVINQTEALVSIDVNSGRATREHSIEETAHKTNLEAADEIARQLRLRDLAGLIVIDFIDMEDHRNDRDVERRLREAVKNDRARIQIGKISQFGLLEMSRQRLRAGVVAGSTVPCPHCAGQGIVRSVESTALRVLRALDEEGQQQRASAVSVKAPVEVIIYTLNQKRREIARIEADYGMAIMFDPDDKIMPGNFEVLRTAHRAPEDRIKLPPVEPLPLIEPEIVEAEAPTELEEDIEDTVESEDVVRHAEAPMGERDGGRRRKRRRRRGRDREDGVAPAPRPDLPAPVHAAPFGDLDIPDTTPGAYETHPPQATNAEDQNHHQPRADSENPEGGRRRRRRRRRGRRGRRDGESFSHGEGENAARGNPQDFENPTRPTEDAAYRSTSEQGPAPNTPSAPVWTLSPDIPAEAKTPAPPAEETKVPKTEQQDASSQERGDQPARKGWWQRAFRTN